MFQSFGLISEQINILSGKVNGFAESGSVLIDIPDIEQSIPCSVLTMSKSEIPQFEVGDKVLVIFNSSENKGYILGFVNVTGSLPKKVVENSDEQKDHLEMTLPQKPKELNVNGKKITIEADDEIYLKCGKSSFLMSKDGKVIIRGTYLVSRSSGVNKVKGTSVAIN